MTRRHLPLVALMLVIAGCDFKETRSGQIVLTPAGAAGIPLNGKAGPASVVAGSAELTFKKGSSDKSIALRVKQSGRPDVELEATIAGDYTSGNFTLKGVTNEVEFTASFTEAGVDAYGNEQIGIELEGEIDRTDYGVNFNMPLPTGGLALGEKVKLSASLSFVKEA